MTFKSIAGFIGLALLLAFLAPPVIKLKNFALLVVVLIGAGMAVYEYVENLRGKND